ncbi:hypothetical protein H0H93_008419 [Arthromyces matolae]|nr:hypothetical protein H0H93_008419 [Arthromyces matolae]
MTLPPTTTELISSLEQYDDVVSWINDILDTSEDGNPTELAELDERITHLLATLDIACEDTSSQLERTIDDVSRGIPRLTYDLHFMKDSAVTLQSSLEKVLQRCDDTIPPSTAEILNQLRHLDVIKGQMELTRDALREAESWGSLELEVTSLLSERSYAKAAERLSEASRSMVVFHNTPEYEPRRALMVNLQNQLEASLSSALVAAINSQDVSLCQSYFSIFSHIQRESEFRNYYNASRRGTIVTLWHDIHLNDCESFSTSLTPSESFIEFLPKFYAVFLSIIDAERISVPAIFPNPAITLSGLISSILSSLQPSFSQRLSSMVSHYGELSLPRLITTLRATEEFAASVEKVIQNLVPVQPSSTSEGSSGDPLSQTLPTPTNPRSHSRRRSMRMSISWHAGANLPSVPSTSIAIDGMEWVQELFQPFLDFQSDYVSLEKRFLDNSLRKAVQDDGKSIDVNRARLLRERVIDVVAIAEDSLTRCTAFTYGYGSVGLVSALDNLFKSFVDMWTPYVRTGTRDLTSQSLHGNSSDDLSDMDYSPQDWSDFQSTLHLLSAARTVYERTQAFELRLRSNLSQTATRFRSARAENSLLAPSRGESQLLEQSTLNSAELYSLFSSLEVDTHSREPSLPSTRHISNSSTSSEPLLVEGRKAISTFASSCQIALQQTILSPLRKHLSAYPLLPQFSAAGDPKAKHTMTGNDLQMPTFSLSPTETVQRVAEGLLNLPRLFEVYADDDALAFSLHTLPHVDTETLKILSEQTLEALPSPTHMRRSSLVAKAAKLDPDAVSSAWLSSLGHSLLEYLTRKILPSIPALSPAGAAQLASDLEYLSNIVRAINVEFEELERWKELSTLDDDEGKQRVSEADNVDAVLRVVAKLRRIQVNSNEMPSACDGAFKLRFGRLGGTTKNPMHLSAAVIEIDSFNNLSKNKMASASVWISNIKFATIAAIKLSREEFRRQKDLDAARKAGTAPAALDEQGKPINPHIPQYISQAPWYLDTGAPSLSHQRRPENDDSSKKLNEWNDRGAKAGPAAKKYRKGACENCGAMTHKRADCMERPRKKGAKYTNENIQADEIIQDISTGYAAKRDRWNGYDAGEHQAIYEEYAAVEAARQKLREEEIDSQTTTDLAAVRKVAKAGKGEGKEKDLDFGSSDEEDADEDKYADAADAVGQKLDAKTRITVRNLRIREDTAKYLINLDPDSAYYDPKTRSMRDAPNKNVPAEEARFAGDNFLRYSGEAPAVQELQLFAWQAAARGNDVHFNANPTQGELLHQEFKQKTDELKDKSKISVLAKYGGAQYLESVPKELIQGQTENYVEYSRSGQVIKGKERAKARSKYPEDAVWGSWYDGSTSTWGYACCHSIIHVSYCSGLAGIEATQASSAQQLLASDPVTQPPPTSSTELSKEKEKAAGRFEQNYSKQRIGEGDIKLDRERLAHALDEEKKRKLGGDHDDRSGKKMKGALESSSHDVTEEELEAYRMNRRMTEDPMANYVDPDI